MSKKRQEFEKGLDRLYTYLNFFLQNDELPEEEDIWYEIKSIRSFRYIRFEISYDEDLKNDPKGFFFILCEDYDRYSDAIPSAMFILLLSNTKDDPKSIDRLVTSKP